MIRILVVEDYAAIRQSLAFMIEHEPDMTVIGQAGTLGEARHQLDGVDVAIIDLDLRGESGAELIPRLHALNPDARALVLTGSTDRREQARAVEAGADALMHKTVNMAEIIDVVRRLHAGEQLLSVQEAANLVRGAKQEHEQTQSALNALARLSPREREVLQAVAEGLGDKEIAGRLQIGVETVRTHIVTIRRKLRVNSRLQAAVLAIRYGLIEAP